MTSPTTHTTSRGGHLAFIVLVLVAFGTAFISTSGFGPARTAAPVIAEGTVKNHVTSILGKLGVRDRAQAALKARGLG